MEKYFFKVITVWVIYNNNKEILLAQRSMNEDVYPWYWSIPWWKLEVINWINRNILEENLKKEITEEIWIQIDNIKYINSHIWYNENQNKIYIAFLCKHISWQPLCLEDTQDVKYFTQNELKWISFPPNVEEIISEAFKIIENDNH